MYLCNISISEQVKDVVGFVTIKSFVNGNST